MRKFLLFFLKRPILWFGDYITKAPKKEDVFKSLSQLYHSQKNVLLKRLKIVEMDCADCKIIVFSDQHRGNRSWADDFSSNEKNYLAALQYYLDNGYTLVNLGDSEELWKFNVNDVFKYNEKSTQLEVAFHPDRYYKTFGNHDLMWKGPIEVSLFLDKYFTPPITVYEGLLVKLKNLSKPLDVFMTHGHQGDKMSDNNAVATWVVAHIWMPLQRYLRLNINTPSTDFTLRNRHNQLMYEWSARRKNTLMVTGHTHKPVFASGKYATRHQPNIATHTTDYDLKPTYFNTGCCCYADGDITGIEIDGGMIRLVKWTNEEINPERQVLEEQSFEQIIKDLA